MGILDGKVHTATDKTVKAFQRVHKRFGCGLCTVRFTTGDQFRFVFANFPDSPAKTGNFFVCADCDNEDDKLLVQRAKADELYKELDSMR